jgi:hypothetical protein
MSVQIRGNGGTIAEIEATTRGQRVVPKPEYAVTGHYGLSLASGVMAAGLAAGAEIVQFRFLHASNCAVIRRVRLYAGGIGAFAAGAVRFDLIKSLAWTVDGSGGALANVATNNGKKRSSMSTISGSALRVATTAALGAGTKTLDAQALCAVGGSTTAVAGTPLITPHDDLFDADDGNMHPLVLGNQEGFSIRATVPATGTWTFGVDVDFFEDVLANYV